MKASFAAVSIDGTDNGWINSAAEFKTLMSSVGAPARPQPPPLQCIGTLSPGLAFGQLYGGHCVTVSHALCIAPSPCMRCVMRK